MRPSDILCRLCRYPYSTLEGCAVCEPAKKNVVWPSDNTEAASELDSSTSQMLRILQSNMDALEHSMKSAPTREYYPKHGTEATKIARAMAALVAEMRKLEDRQYKAVQKMSFDEKVDLFMDFFDDLPQEHQEKLLQGSMKRLEAARVGASDVLTAEYEEIE